MVLCMMLQPQLVFTYEERRKDGDNSSDVALTELTLKMNKLEGTNDTLKEIVEGELLKTDEIDSIIGQVKNMENAEELEIEQGKQYLGDDDEANEGDLEQQLENLSDAAMKERLANVIYDAEKKRDVDSSHELDDNNFFLDIEKIKEQIKEKPINDDGTSIKNKKEGRNIKNLIQKLDAKHWKIIRERLEKDHDFTTTMMNNKKRKMASIFAERKRLMMQRQEKVLRDRGIEQEEFIMGKVKDLTNRNDSWKNNIFLNKQNRSVKSGMSISFSTENVEQSLGGNIENEENVANNEEPPYIKRQLREMYEEQGSSIVLKDFLFGLLGILIANWFILQVCLCRDKRRKGRRNL